MTCQVPEEKKSWTPPKVLAITGGFFRSSTQQETRARRSPPGRRSRKRRRSACRQRSPSYALILGEIGQQVKGAGDEHRPAGRPCRRQRRSRALDRLDLGEVAAGPPPAARGPPRPPAAPPRRRPAGARRRGGGAAAPARPALPARARPPVPRGR